MITIPTLQELKDEILTNIQSEFGITIPAWKKAFLKALSAVLAAGFKMMYLTIGKVQKNVFVDTAEQDQLERFGRVKIGRGRFPASQGKYEAAVTGLFGGIIPAQTQFISDFNSQNPGQIFILDTEYTLPGTSGTIELRAVSSGTSSRLAIGDTLTATAPIINVDGGAAVTGELIVPNNEEDIEAYRQVVIESFQLEPQGGAPADYRIWGRDASGVRQIYPYTASNQPNEINVYVEATVADSTDGMGTPTSTILNDVAAAIEADPVTSDGRRPLGVFAVNTLPIVVNKIFIKITGFQGLTLDKQTLIMQGLSEGIGSIRPFIAGADTLAQRNDALSNNNVVNIILNTIPGAVFGATEIKVQIGVGPINVVTNKIFDNGNIPHLESVTYD